MKIKNFQQFFIIFFLLISVKQLIAQNTYSEFALTGRGDLVLSGKSYKLQQEVLEAFKRMKQEALKEGIQIKIVSAYRSFNHQKNIWNRKYNKFLSEGLSAKDAVNKIIEYSTIPGTSRHHWGTDIDIIDAAVKLPKNLLVEANYEKEGVYSNLKKWMDENSEKFGFYLVYTSYNNRKGFKYEPWHYSYKPISKLMLKDFSSLDVLQLIESSNIKGKQILTKEFIEKYCSENMLDINKDLF